MLLQGTAYQREPVSVYRLSGSAQLVVTPFDAGYVIDVNRLPASYPDRSATVEMG